MTVREANQNFSQVVAAAERGETIIITKNGQAVARIAPQGAERRDDPEWRVLLGRLKRSLRAKKPTGLRVGRISEDDLYGDEGGKGGA